MTVVADERKITIKRGVYLTNGKTLVLVRRVLDDSVLVMDAIEPCDTEMDAELLALTPQEVAADWEEVPFTPLDIDEKWLLVPKEIEHLSAAVDEIAAGVDEANPNGVKSGG